MNKEEAYDTKISPLMTQIIAICKEHGIAMIMSFAIPTEDDDGLLCTTCLPDENGKNAYGHVEAFRLLRNEKPVVNIRTDNADGSTTMTSFIG